GTFDDTAASILFNRGDGTFGEPVELEAGYYAKSVMSADLNGDGQPDLVVGTDGSYVYVFLNRGNGRFDPPSAYAPRDGLLPIAVADTNGDGYPDLVALGENTLSVLLNQKDGTFLELGQLPVGTFPWSITSADLNGDGAPDLVTSNSETRSVSV